MKDLEEEMSKKGLNLNFNNRPSLKKTGSKINSKQLRQENEIVRETSERDYNDKIRL